MRVVTDVSVMAAYFGLLYVCTVHRILLHGAQFTRTRVKICHHNTDVNNDMHIGTRYVILAKHWMWLPDDDSFRPHYGLGVDSASNRNEYQEYFLGLKAAGA